MGKIITCIFIYNKHRTMMSYIEELIFNVFNWKSIELDNFTVVVSLYLIKIVLHAQNNPIFKS